jgi:hypothetical protein
VAFYGQGTLPPTPPPKTLGFFQGWIIDLNPYPGAQTPTPSPFYGTAVVTCGWDEYGVVTAQTGPNQLGDRFGITETMPKPSPTPDITLLSWSFSGSVVEQVSGERVGGATLTLYRRVGTEWQAVDSSTTDAHGRFLLEASGGTGSGRFRLVRQDPAGYAAVGVDVAPHFGVANPDEITSVFALPPGRYTGLHFLSRSEGNATPLPSRTPSPTVTRTPWPTVTPPWLTPTPLVTVTPPWPTPTP